MNGYGTGNLAIGSLADSGYKLNIANRNIAIGFSSFSFINPDALTRTVITEKYKRVHIGWGYKNIASGYNNIGIGNQSFVGGGYKIISGSYLKV